jgi:hypothetical protein
VLGDSIIRNLKSELRVYGVFQELELNNRGESWKTDLGRHDTVVIHFHTKYLRRTVNLSYVMGYICAMVNKAKTNFLHSKLILSDLLRQRDMSWRRIRALNAR